MVSTGTPAWRLYHPFRGVFCRCYVDGLPPNGPWAVIVWEGDSVLFSEEIDDRVVALRRSERLYEEFLAGGWTEIIPRS
jgi:hypothetical protein